MQVIVFKNEDSTIGIILPTPECLQERNLFEIAYKDVPTGLPFWIMNSEELPSDYRYRDAWELENNIRPADGYGSTSNNFEELVNDCD